MAGFKACFGFFCLILLNLSVLGSKLNVPRILLPIFSDFATKFTLEAVEGGCYKWTTTRSDIIKLAPVDENKNLECSTKAVVSTITKEQARNLAVVLAEDVNTAQLLKCDVIVDVIHNLSITTTTRELFMEEVPEVFQINAYDEQGNEFSTLEGVEFEWNILSTGPNRDNIVLRYLQFKDSSYETPPFIRDFEEQNKKGYMVLLEGVKTGSAKVSVRLPYMEYKHVKSVEVVLTVIANLLLTPTEVYAMPGDVISFKLYYLSSGRMDEISLKEHMYFLQSDDPKIAKSDKNSNEVTALSLGRTRIVLHNMNLAEDDPALKLPSAMVNVVQPGYITLNILPYKNWAILVGDQYEIVADIFSSTNHKMYLGNGVEITIQIDEGFHIEERSRNGSWVTGWGIKESKAKVHASLDMVVHPKLGKFTLETPLTATAEIYIYPRITISPAEVILPWDPQTKPKYEIDLIAKGGDNRFAWSSTDLSIGIVTQNGHVRTLDQGFFQIAASMARNHHNRQIAKFSILPPARLEIAEFIMEAEVGAPIYLHVALYAEKPSTSGQEYPTYIPFTQCQELPFQVKSSDTKFIHNKTDVVPPVGISCGNIAMVGTAVGTSKITVTYYQDNVYLEDSVTISAYNPLKLIQPEKQIVLAVGSSINLLYSGGPRPIIGRPGDHQRLAISQSEAVIQAEDITEGQNTPTEDQSVLWVLCRKLGETSVKLMISNTPTMPNCKSRPSTLVTKIVCGKPRRIHLQPEIKVTDPLSCPMDLSADRVIVPNDRDVDLNVVIQDEIGRTFLNISTLLLNWEAVPKLAKFAVKDGTYPQNITIGTVDIADKSLQTIQILQDVTLIEITATVASYKLAMLKKYQITPEWPEFLTGDERVQEIPVIKSTLGLFLVNDTKATPNFTVIFNQPDQRKTIHLQHGSGYVELMLSADDVINVNYLEDTREIEIAPIRSGDVTIQVVDLCLISEPVFVTVKVTTIDRIEVQMADKVEINHCIEVVVTLFDETDQVMDLSEVGPIDLRNRFTHHIANLGMMPVDKDNPWPTGEIHYVLTGVKLGNTQLIFSFEKSDRQVTSLPADLQVFPPLKVYPRNTTLLVGSSVQLTISGGPQPEGNIEFTIVNNNTAEISATGIVRGRSIGTTRIVARAIGVHSKTGDRIVFSEDAVEVNVIPLRGIKIGSPLTKLMVGATIPIWAMGIPEQISTMVLGSYEDSSIEFDWYVLESEVAAISGMYMMLGILYSPSDRVAIRLTGFQAGRTRLNVNVTVDGSIAGEPLREKVQFHSELDIEVIETMNLINPPGLSGKSLLMAQHTSIQLETDLDNLRQIKYTLPAEDLPPVDNNNKSSNTNSPAVIRGILSVSEKGLLKSHGAIGYGMLLVSALDDQGVQQTLCYVVEVKPIHYMMLTIVAGWRIHLDSSLRSIPLGTEFEIVPYYYDNLGNKFSAGPTDVKLRSNRLDLIKIKHLTNATKLEVATKKAGSTMTKIWTDGTHLTADYVKIHSEEVIKPILDTLTNCDILCLWSPVVTKFLQHLRWTSSDDSLIKIDPLIDVAYVVGNKEGTVNLKNPLHPNAPLILKVLPVAKVTFEVTPDVLITNGPDGVEFRIPVVFKNAESPEHKRNNLIQGWHCDRVFGKHIVPTPFKCNIAFTDPSAPVDANVIFDVKSSFQPGHGHYKCKIWVVASNTEKLATLETSLSMWVITDEGEFESHVEELPFLPNVYASNEVTIPEDNIGELTVIGLETVLRQIIVVPADSSIVFVDSGHLVNKTEMKYKVQLIDYHPKLAGFEESMGIIIESPITKQKFSVMVKVTTKIIGERCQMGKSPFLDFVQAYQHSLIIVGSVFVIFLATCYIYAHYMKPVVNVNVHPNRSLLSATTGHQQRRNTTCSPNRISPNQSSLVQRFSPVAHICGNKLNCSCGSPTREPVYGDVNTFSMNSPELRRNRRFL